MFQKNGNESVQSDTVVQWLALIPDRMKVVGSIPGLRVCMFSSCLAWALRLPPTGGQKCAHGAKNVRLAEGANGLFFLMWLQAKRAERCMGSTPAAPPAITSGEPALENRWLDPSVHYKPVFSSLRQENYRFHFLLELSKEGQWANYGCD